MMSQAQDFLDESRALHALVAPLSAEALARPTAFKNWTIDRVLRHLHVWNVAADMSLADDGRFEAFYAGAAKALEAGGLEAFERDRADGLSGPELVATWAAFCEEMAPRFGAADPKARVKWAGPDMSVRSSITARLMETWAHGQEVYDLLGVARVNADRIRNIVILGVNTYGWTFKVHGEAAPEPMPYLVLTAPSGAVWTFGEDSDAERIEGLAEEFCQVVTQTRNIADTALKVTGPNATRWMAIAQCFAGPPETPPAPGARGPGR